MKQIMLHGLGQSAASWDDTVSAMGQGPEILCPELSGWISKGAASYSGLYGELERYCEQFDAPLNLCGLSLGGILALNYALEHPERVNRLLLVGTQYVMPRGLLRLQNVLFHLMPRRAFTEIGMEKRDFIDLCASMMNLDFQAGLSQISCPVLIVCGEKDNANKAASEQMKEQIPGARLVLIPGAGHEVNRDKPDELGRVVSGFFMEKS